MGHNPNVASLITFNSTKINNKEADVSILNLGGRMMN